jgi:hypothetical protein
MSNIAKSRGSKNLTGAAALRYRMPAMGDFPASDIAQRIEQQLGKLWVAGSIPAVSPIATHPCTGLYFPLN